MDTGTTIIWRNEAKEDLRDVIHYLSGFPTAYVDNWSDELTRKLALLESFPEMGRIVPEKQVSHLREFFSWELSDSVHLSQQPDHHYRCSPPVQSVG